MGSGLRLRGRRNFGGLFASHKADGHALCGDNRMASILVIAADPNIESLMGQLVALTGHRAIYDVTLGAAGESIRRVRPDVTMLDVALPPGVVEACLQAAHEVRSRPVLTYSGSESAELAAEARARKALYFALPTGAPSLRSVLQRALQELRRKPPVNIDARRYEATG